MLRNTWQKMNAGVSNKSRDDARAIFEGVLMALGIGNDPRNGAMSLNGAILMGTLFTALSGAKPSFSKSSPSINIHQALVGLGMVCFFQL